MSDLGFSGHGTERLEWGRYLPSASTSWSRTFQLKNSVRARSITSERMATLAG